RGGGSYVLQLAARFPEGDSPNPSVLSAHLEGTGEHNTLREYLARLGAPVPEGLPTGVTDRDGRQTTVYTPGPGDVAALVFQAWTEGDTRILAATMAWEDE
ncbi:MAG TPA: hypothetical protein VMM12_18085, partial [Longimicrobiales bacterium]|nr:hypothetical protein [Longimicrobiales bacterium]